MYCSTILTLIHVKEKFTIRLFVPAAYMPGKMRNRRINLVVMFSDVILPNKEQPNADIELAKLS